MLNFQTYHRKLSRPANMGWSMVVIGLALTAGTVCRVDSVAWAQPAPKSATQQRLNLPTATFTTEPAPLLVADEPFALSEALVRELRKGGYVLYLKHAAIQPGTRDVRGKGDWWKKCETTQRVGATALPQSQAIGQAWTKQRIQIESIRTSEFCRAFDTAAFLGLAAPVRTYALNDSSIYPATKTPSNALVSNVHALLKETPAQGKNRVLVGHNLPPNEVLPALSNLPDGHTAIYRSTDGRVHLVAILSPAQWSWIGKQTYNDPAVIVAGQGNAVLTPTPPPPPVIDPAKELKGAALIAAIRQGGYNLYMRHGQATIGMDASNFPTTPNWWENCAIQRNLTEAGKDQARKVGSMLREFKIPVARVRASQFCRVRETAELMGVGAPEVTEDLNHVIGQRVGTDINASRLRLLTEVPQKEKNNLLVSHTHGSPRKEEMVMGGIQEAEIVVFLPDGKGAVEPIGRIPVQEWDKLLAQGLSTSPTK